MLSQQPTSTVTAATLRTQGSADDSGLGVVMLWSALGLVVSVALVRIDAVAAALALVN